MTDTVTLGGRVFRLQPLTLGQLRPLLDALDALSGTGGAAMPGSFIDAAARILQAGLAAAEPGLTIDEVLALAAPIGEVNAAVAAILRLAGLLPQKEPRPGEPAPAASPSAPGSPPFTAPSPPAAAIPIAPSTA